MRFLIFATLAVLMMAASRRRMWRHRPYPNRARRIELAKDYRWARGLHELAARRRGMGWA